MPVLLAGPVARVLAAWGTLRHYLTFWPHFRFALAWLLIALPLVALVLWLLRRAERRHALATRLVRRVGETPLVFAGVLLLYVASSGGHLYTPDEWMVYAAGVGLAQHGVPAAFADEPYPLHLLTSPIAPREREPDGSYRYAYSKYGITISAMVTPLYALGRLIGSRPDLPEWAFPFGTKAVPIVPLLLNPLVTAATAALVFAIARALGYSRHAGVIAALGFAFGSLAWVYSKTLMSMAPAALFAAGALFALVRAGQVLGPGRALWLAVAGASTGLSIATRYEMWLFLTPLVVPLAACLRRAGRRGVLRHFASFAVPLIVVVIPLVFGVNLMRTGSVFETGYGAEGQLSSITEKPWYGWFGILLSPGCGLAVHTPLMILGLIALIWLWEDAPLVAWAAGGGALLAIGYYGAFDTWCGFTAWGPRYLVNVGPFMALPLAALWQRSRPSARNPFLWLMGGGLVAWSVGTNLLAVLIDFNHGWQDHWSHGVTYLEVTWLPFFSGITSHLRLLREWLFDGRPGIDLYLWHALGPTGPPVTALLALTGLGGFAALWLARLPVSGSGAAPAAAPVEHLGVARGQQPSTGGAGAEGVRGRSGSVPRTIAVAEDKPPRYAPQANRSS